MASLAESQAARNTGPSRNDKAKALRHRIDERAALWAKLLVCADLRPAVITSLGDHVPPSQVLCHGYVSVGRQNIRALDGRLSPHGAHPVRILGGGLDFRTATRQSLTQRACHHQLSM